MEKEQATETEAVQGPTETENTQPPAEKPLPASPTFDVEVVSTDPEQEPVSTHSFCTTCSGY